MIGALDIVMSREEIIEDYLQQNGAWLFFGLIAVLAGVSAAVIVFVLRRAKKTESKKKKK